MYKVSKYLKYNIVICYMILFRMLVPDNHLDKYLPMITPICNCKEDVSWLLDIFEDILFHEYPRTLDPVWYKVKFHSRKEYQQQRAIEEDTSLKIIDRLDFIREQFFQSIIDDETFLMFLSDDMKLNHKLHIKIKKVIYRSLFRTYAEYQITDVFILYKTEGNDDEEDTNMMQSMKTYFKTLKYNLIYLFVKSKS